MKLVRDLVVIGVSAAVVALAAVPFVVPAATAEDEAPLLAALVEPKPLDLSGVTVSVEVDPATARPGAELAATLHAANLLDGEGTRHFKVLMHVKPAPNPMSRMIPMPKLAWSTDVSVRLAKGETKTLALRPAIAVQKGEVVTFWIQADGCAGPVAEHALEAEDALKVLLPVAKQERP
jgi:hypothetical protein